MEQGLITFFDVKDCGFYRMKNKKPVHVEGSLSNSLELVHKWVKDRDFDQTIPWDAKNNPNRARIYCKSAHFNPATGDYVFVYWKQYGEDNGNINGILSKSKVDDKGVDTHKVKANVKGQDVILGDPMYYWYIPQHNLIASIKFPHSLSDTDAVLGYTKKCIDLRISHPRKKQSEHTLFNTFLGKDIITKNVTYKSEDGSYSLNFKIDAEMKELSLNDVSLEALAKRITHLVVRESISSSKEIEKDTIFSMFDKFRRQKKRPLSKQKQVEIISQESYTAEELESILSTYNTVHESKNSWDNVGFKIDGIEKPTKWFDKYVDRKKVFIHEDNKKDDHYFPAEVIMTHILEKRGHLLDFMKHATHEKADSDFLASNLSVETEVAEA